MTLDVVALTQAMVRIPSLSGQESEMAALMGAVMRERGSTRSRSTGMDRCWA